MNKVSKGKKSLDFWIERLSFTTTNAYFYNFHNIVKVRKNVRQNVFEKQNRKNLFPIDFPSNILRTIIILFISPNQLGNQLEK